MRFLDLLYRQVILFLSASMLSMDCLENKQELPVKARALAKAPPINISMLAILDVDVFR